MATKKQKGSIDLIIATADILAEQHVAYTDQFVARANDELYKLLSCMMQLCVDILSNACCDEIIRKIRKALVEKYNLKTQAKSKVASIVVKYVTGTGRKTAHVYGRAIQAAIDAGISPADFPSYIYENGGIDAIRKKGVAAQAAQATEQDTRRETMLGHLVDYLHDKAKKSLGTIRLANGEHKLKMLHDATEFKYLICSNSPKTGELEVVAVAYPTREIETKLLSDYATAMQLAALEHTNLFWDSCKKLNADCDTINTWREANGVATAADALEQACRMGAYVSDAELELILATDDYKKKVERDKIFADLFEYIDEKQIKEV